MTPPTSILPPLARISQYSPGQITEALNGLRGIYWSAPATSRITTSQLPRKLGQPKSRVQRFIHDESVPDSGYASAEEDEEEEFVTNVQDAEDVEEEDGLDIIRADTFEREYAIKWLTGFIARSDTWLAASCPQDEDERYEVMDHVTSLLSAFAGRPEVQSDKMKQAGKQQARVKTV